MTANKPVRMKIVEANAAYRSECGLTLSRNFDFQDDSTMPSGWVLKNASQAVLMQSSFRSDIADAHNLVLER